MALIVEIRINHDKLYTMAAERMYDKKTGLNPYKIRLYDNESNVIRETSVGHIYEDGAIKLVARMCNEFSEHGIIRTSKKVSK